MYWNRELFPEDFYLMMHLVTPTQVPSEKPCSWHLGEAFSVTSGNITWSHPL